MSRILVPLAAVALVAGMGTGCATAPPTGGSATGTGTGAGAETLRGSLRMEEITVEVQVDGVLVRLTPLAPAIVELTAPDTRRRLESLASLQGEGVAFLVSVFTEEAGGADFEPRSVTLENRGRVLRPIGVRGLTPGWGRRLEQRRAERAVYTFPADLDLEMSLVVDVAGTRSGEWASILPRVDAERARIRTRGGQLSSPYFRILR